MSSASAPAALSAASASALRRWNAPKNSSATASRSAASSSGHTSNIASYASPTTVEASTSSRAASSGSPNADAASTTCHEPPKRLHAAQNASSLSRPGTPVSAGGGVGGGTVVGPGSVVGATVVGGAVVGGAADVAGRWPRWSGRPWWAAAWWAPRQARRPSTPPATGPRTRSLPPWPVPLRSPRHARTPHAMLGDMPDSTSDPATGASDRPRILLDCDPGHDDVVAIIVANHAADLVGITTVAGNAPLDRTTYNACVMRDLLGLTAPVHSGAVRPLIAPPLTATFVHGESGLDGADLPAPARGADSTDAVGFIIDTCRAAEGTWLVPTGPLTNIALALRAAPDLVDRIAGISLMGGGTFGNRAVMSEFNIWADPTLPRSCSTAARRSRWPASTSPTSSSSPTTGSGTSMRSPTSSAASSPRCWPTCSASSPTTTSAATTTSPARRSTTRSRSWRSPILTCSAAAAGTWPSRRGAS
jgi:hypothetical protein